MRIPNTFGINDDHRSVAALIEAAGFVDADLLFQSVLGNLLTQLVADLDSSLTGADLAGDADEYMFSKYFQLTPVSAGEEHQLYAAQRMRFQRWLPTFNCADGGSHVKKVNVAKTISGSMLTHECVCCDND